MIFPDDQWIVIHFVQKNCSKSEALSLSYGSIQIESVLEQSGEDGSRSSEENEIPVGQGEVVLGGDKKGRKCPGDVCTVSGVPPTMSWGQILLIQQ